MSTLPSLALLLVHLRWCLMDLKRRCMQELGALLEDGRGGDCMWATRKYKPRCFHVGACATGCRGFAQVLTGRHTLSVTGVALSSWFRGLVDHCTVFEMV